jgi:hypothetical protein
MMCISRIALLSQLLLAVGAWSFQGPLVVPAQRSGSSALLAENEHNGRMTTGGSQSRRQIFARTGAMVASGVSFAALLGGPQQPALAAGETPPTKEELDRIKTGYEGLRYLLDNWDKETTVCRENGGECKRNADKVRKYLGLRSTTDPLFQIEKVFGKVKYMDNVDFDKLDDFYQATEDWNTAQNMSNSMAFISQFGEYNPGGGKDSVLKYLTESQLQVVQAEGALKRIMESLDI